MLYQAGCAGNGGSLLNRGKMIVNLKPARIFCLMILLIGCPGISAVCPAGAFEFNLQFSGGYDDNVTLTDDASGSGFGLYRIGLIREIYKDAGLTSALFLDGTYQDYFRFSDNYTIRAGGMTDWSFSDLLLPGIYYEALMYRDREFASDDLNEFLFGGRIDWLASVLWTISVDQSLAFQDGEIQDLETVRDGSTSLTGHGRHGMGSRTGTGGASGIGGATDIGTSASGDGFLSRSSAGITAHPFPALDVGLRLMFNRRWASGEDDAYREYGFAIFSRWEPSCRIIFDRLRICPQLRMQLEYRKADYLNDGPDTDRTDTIRSAQAGLALPFDAFELFAHGRWADIDSTSAIETYRKGVLQCGISWFF